jgi:SAM-dependent methyltransferase
VIPRTGAKGAEDRGVTADRVVLDDDVCTIVALQPAPLPPAHVPDGLPLPPPEFVGLTMGIFEGPGVYEGFLESGATDAQAIRDALGAHGLEVRQIGAMLEFGCGSGRVLRHWSDLPDTRVHGSDFNPHMIEWCRGNLPLARFTVNGVAPPLEYDDGSFDLVYAVSVFTHLLEPLQLPWLRELARVVRPGGHLLLSLNGRQMAEQLLEGEQRERFAAGEFAELWAERAGTNACTVFHPERYRREEFATPAGLEIVEERVDAVCNAGQDLLVLRRPG